MEPFVWWTEEHKKLAVKVQKFVEEIIPESDEGRFKREYPWRIMNKINAEGLNKVAYPKEYGGMELGAVGALIAQEQMGRMPGAGRLYSGSLIGGLKAVLDHGTEEQKKRFIPLIVEGEPGAVCITEPFAGTDAADIRTTARREGDKYILNGKKRYIVNAGVAQRHMVYARTSDDPEAKRRYGHLTCFIVEKGMPGFTVERINEVIGFDDCQNGALNLKNVQVPVENRLGKEGEGFKVMMAGLNMERLLISGCVIGWLYELMRAVVPYTQRRVQFGQTTADMVHHKLRIADLFMKFRLARLNCHYAAHLLDLGHDIQLNASMAKAFNCESALESARDVIHMMGGDGVTPLYLPHSFFALGKVEEIAGGTMEAMRLAIYRMGLKEMAEDLEMPNRVIHEELGVPINTYKWPERDAKINEEKLLKVLAEDYRVNPALHMSREDLKKFFEVEDKKLDDLLMSLEEKGLVDLYRVKKGIALAKATYEGLDKANPPEYYRWFPSWADETRRF